MCLNQPLSLSGGSMLILCFSRSSWVISLVGLCERPSSTRSPSSGLSAARLALWHTDKRSPRAPPKAELSAAYSHLKKAFRWRKKASNIMPSVFLIRKMGQCLKECSQPIRLEQNSKEKFPKSTWSLLALWIARDWLKLVPFPKSIGRFDFRFSVMVEYILSANTYRELLMLRLVT